MTNLRRLAAILCVLTAATIASGCDHDVGPQDIPPLVLTTPATSLDKPTPARTDRNAPPVRRTRPRASTQTPPNRASTPQPPRASPTAPGTERGRDDAPAQRARERDDRTQGTGKDKAQERPERDDDDNDDDDD